MTEPNDAALVEQCLRGDQHAFGLLLDRYQKTVFNVALRMVRDFDEAQEITQSTFVKAYENLRSFNPKYKFFSWLYRIAVNESLNSINQRKRLSELSDDVASDEDDPEGSVNTVELNETIEASIMRLKPEFRIVIVLRHFLDLPYNEIGQILDIPEQAVKSRLFGARQILRKHLSRKGL